MDLNAIVSAFASKITTALPYMSGDGYPISPVSPPCFEIDFPSDGLVFNTTMGNKTNDFDVIVRCFAAGGVDSGVKQLYTWLSDGAEGITVILNADKTLGSTVDNLYVRSASAPILVPIDNQLYLTAEWRVNLIVSPS